MLNQRKQWLAFCPPASAARTIVHFFPCAGRVTAPYAATLHLTIFGNGIERQRVVLEGARVSQPDGVQLDQAFPELGEMRSGFFGLEIELATTQPRLDLSSSACIIELQRGGNSVKFRPAQADPEDPAPDDTLAGLAQLSEQECTSLLVVNPSSADFVQDFNKLGSCTISAGRVCEFPLVHSVFASAVTNQGQWGTSAFESFEFQPANADAAYYLLYRDRTNHYPLQVAAL